MIGFLKGLKNKIMIEFNSNIYRTRIRESMSAKRKIVEYAKAKDKDGKIDWYEISKSGSKYYINDYPVRTGKTVEFELQMIWEVKLIRFYKPYEYHKEISKNWNT